MKKQELIEILGLGSYAWNAWRKLNQEIPINLSRERLNFNEVDEEYIVRGYLNDVNLSDSDLTGIDLQEIDLRGANFSNSKLTSANFSYAYLDGADFTESTCIRTNFTGSSLKETTFSNSTFMRVVFGDTNLSTAIGLDEVLHLSHSIVDVDTIERYWNDVSREFWLRIGVPEYLISSLAEMVRLPSTSYSCFISYSHADRAFAHRLHDALQERGIRCWLDEKQILPGHDIYEEVDRGIRLWDKILLCASETSLTSWRVDKEQTEP
jgi:hypothetical protein